VLQRAAPPVIWRPARAGLQGWRHQPAMPQATQVTTYLAMVQSAQVTSPWTRGTPRRQALVGTPSWHVLGMPAHEAASAPQGACSHAALLPDRQSRWRSSSCCWHRTGGDTRASQSPAACNALRCCWHHALSHDACPTQPSLHAFSCCPALPAWLPFPAHRQHTQQAQWAQMSSNKSSNVAAATAAAHPTRHNSCCQANPPHGAVPTAPLAHNPAHTHAHARTCARARFSACCFCLSKHLREGHHAQVQPLAAQPQYVHTVRSTGVAGRSPRSRAP
jgi:hypothetical protein